MWRPPSNRLRYGDARRLGEIFNSQFLKSRPKRVSCMSACRKETTTHPATDIEGLVSITLEEAFLGKKVPVTVQRRVRRFRVYTVFS